MTSITYIDLNLSAVNCAVVVYAKQNDKLARHIAATLYDGSAAWTPPAGSHPIIRFLKPDGTAGFYDVDENEDPAISISGNVATMTIVEQALTVPGDVYMELNFYNGDGEKLTTLKWLMRVQASVLTDATIISSDYYNVLTEKVAAILGATTHPPYINSTTKNWMLWDEDTGVYVDSGYSSVGLTGPAPTQISSTNEWQNSNSGTTVPTGTWSSTPPATTPGTWRWTRTTTVYDTGTVVSYSAAYQGQDGQGAPGSQTPLMDGTAAVGTATAYSREDHVHPPDTSRLALDGSLANVNPVSNLNNFVTGVAVFDPAGSISNLPNNSTWWLIVAGGNGSNTAVQVAYPLSSSYAPMKREESSGSWGSWTPLTS